MLYEATIKIALPGRTPEEALQKLKDAVPHWPVLEFHDIQPAAVQPPKIMGEGHIKLPAPGVKAT